MASSNPQPTAESPLRDHPRRRELHDEIHARPYEALQPPVRIVHLVQFSGRDSESADRRHVADLCERCDAAAPAETENHAAIECGAYRLKWERRTEFSTYTFIFRADAGTGFESRPLEAVPADWLAAIPGNCMAAIHLLLCGPGDHGAGPEERLGNEPVVGSRVSTGAASVWTDFRIHPDGYSRILVQDHDLGRLQAGRVVQRLLELETYRMMALLAFPVARDMGRELSVLEDRLTELNHSLSGIRGLDDERHLLANLSHLAAEVERLGNTANYRLSAAAAYHELVRRRIEELREQRIPGFQTIRGFLRRRLEPAMRTCETMADRQESLSRRISRTGDLLRTRVDVALEGQNRDLLSSMDRRARLQLRLQQTVEGLSVVAISYYGVGLLGYVLDGVKAAGVRLDSPVVLGGAVPIVVGLVWLAVHTIRGRITREDGSATGKR